MASAEHFITVSVVCSPKAGEVRECVLSLPAAALLQDAMDAALAEGGLGDGFEVSSDTSLGIWGRICERSAPLRDQDRIEIYRPLLVDPKTARRSRSPVFRRKK
jgi:uncharacterized protein